MPDKAFPRSQSQILEWGRNYNDKAGISPATYGLSAESGAAIVSAFAAFETAYHAWMDPATRTPNLKVVKDEAMGEFERVARDTVAEIQTNPATTNEMRSTLRITPRGTEPSPIPRPTQMPILEVRSVVGRMVRLNLRDAMSGRRCKPRGVRSAWLYVHVGETAPTDFGAYTFNGETTRCATEVVFEDEVPAGSKVWVTALWVNATGQVGPACMPVSAWTNGLALSNAA